MENQFPVTRRKFLSSCAALSVGGISLAIIPRSSYAAIIRHADLEGVTAASNPRVMMLDQVTLSAFAAHLGSTFRISDDSGVTHAVELVSVRPIARQIAGPAAREPFSIIFRGRGTQALPQRIYEIHHDQLGSFSIFIVPIGPKVEPNVVEYEAIFN